SNTIFVSTEQRSQNPQFKFSSCQFSVPSHHTFLNGSFEIDCKPNANPKGVFSFPRLSSQKSIELGGEASFELGVALHAKEKAREWPPSSRRATVKSTAMLIESPTDDFDLNQRSDWRASK
ncbi:hypothetical protein ACHAWO_008724, partial [Cyclotella atomus]